MNKMVGIIMGLAILSGCSSNNKPVGINTKDYYFPYMKFITTQTYCFVNTGDTADKSYWIMQTKIEGNDTLFLTNIHDSQHRLMEELVEKISNKGSRMSKYTLYQYEDDSVQLSAPCQVIDSVIFNFTQNLGETSSWKVDFPDFHSKQTYEFSKMRTFVNLDTLNKVATYKDKNRIGLKGALNNYDYEMEICYKKGIGVINYKISTQGRLMKEYKLINN